MVSGSEDKTVKIWETSGNWDCISTIEGHDDFVRVVYGLSSNNAIATGGRDPVLRIWDTKTKDCKYKFRGHTLPIWSILEIEDDRILGTGSSDFTIKIWDMVAGRCLHTMIGHS